MFFCCCSVFFSRKYCMSILAETSCTRGVRCRVHHHEYIYTRHSIAFEMNVYVYFRSCRLLAAASNAILRTTKRQGGALKTSLTNSVLCSRIWFWWPDFRISCLFHPHVFKCALVWWSPRPGCLIFQSQFTFEIGNRIDFWTVNWPDDAELGSDVDGSGWVVGGKFMMHLSLNKSRRSHLV